MNLPFSISEPRALILLLAIVPVAFAGMLGARARRRDRPRIIAGTIIRSLILLFVILALAGLQLIATSGPLNVVFLVDRSASVSRAGREASLQYVRKAIAGMGADDRAGVVLFGDGAVVDRALGADTGWTPSGSLPPEVATNIAQAIQVGAALFPESGSKRLVLLSDGAQTVGDAREIAAGGLAGIQLSVVPLGAQSEHEVAVDRVVSPNSVPAGRQMPVRVLIKSTSDRAVTVTLYDGEQPVGSRDLQITAGDTVANFSIKAQAQGFHVLRAHVASVDDGFAQNNDALSFTNVKKPPSVLILAGAPEDAAALKSALEAGDVAVEIAEPDFVPSDPQKLATYDAVVLANVSAEQLGVEGQRVLQSYVRDLGHGLIMVGGAQSYGAGGYLRSPLEEVMPVTMDVRTSEERASLAMTFVVDKSGSMGRCHCGGSQKFDPSMRTEFGDSKIEIVKQAISKATSLMNSSDQVGVVAYDTQPHWVAALQPIGQLGESRLQELMQPVAAEGDTNMAPGLGAAIDSLQASSAQLKHIVLLSDGWTQQADFSALLNAMQARNITLSAVGVGAGSDDLLRELASKGGGQYYLAKDVKSVPDILLRETIRLTGAYYVEQPFSPVQARAGPILKGIDPDRLPQLLGYNASTLKPDAELVLKSPRGDPVLAQWQYGLGRAVAWTSDAKGQWAADWVAWPQFNRFVGQMVGWTMPAGGTPGLEVSLSLMGSSGQETQDVGVRIDSTTSTGAPRNFLQTSVVLTGTDGITATVPILQRSPGAYDGVIKGLRQGAYSVGVEQREPISERLVALETTGLVVPYPSEFRLMNDSAQKAGLLLGDLAQLGSGKSLDISQPALAFSHDIAAQPGRLALWPWLLLSAILLFPVDVAVRRLNLTPRELWQLMRGKTG